MVWRAEAYRAAIPADYTRSPYPHQYYFEVYGAAGSTIYPGFGPDLSNQLCFLVWSRGAQPANQAG
jgi:hypothetical protein